MSTTYFVVELSTGEVKKTGNWHIVKPFFIQPEYVVLVVDEAEGEMAHVQFNTKRTVVRHISAQKKENTNDA
jgi:hypothetical protein